VGWSTELKVVQTELFPFELPTMVRRVPHFGAIRTQIWSEQKAKLIARYLKLFVFITHHGTYIDGFAGPQYADREDAWTAKLVLESEPRWLRSFFLCDKGQPQIAALNKLVTAQPVVKKRLIQVLAGDFNTCVTQVLSSGHVEEGIATFCLLDQHTFECEWKTVEALAKGKKEDKVELMYFVPTGWIGRAMAAQKDTSVIERWWGRSDWLSLRGMQKHERAAAFCERFKKDLGYAYAHAWPIFDRERGVGRIMYHLIHASDHPEAPYLMARAYRTATKALPPEKQLEMELAELQRELRTTG